MNESVAEQVAEQLRVVGRMLAPTARTARSRGGMGKDGVLNGPLLGCFRERIPLKTMGYTFNSDVKHQ